MIEYHLGITDLARILEDMAMSLAGDKTTNETLTAIRHVAMDLRCAIEGGYGNDLWVQRNLDWLIREGHYESTN